MIDIHCHILPGLDDGPTTVEEALLMARVAVNEGIKHIIATPHHKNNKYENNKQGILGQVLNLNNILHQENIPLTILPGQECRIFGELLEDYRKDEILTLSNTSFLFIEFPTSNVPRYAEKLFYEIQMEGLTPIIVHPERNKEIIENPNVLYNFIKNGALSQVTAGSIAGYFGKSIQKFSKQLIEHNLTHFLASDAHNIHNRSFKMNEGYNVIEKEFGVEFIYMLQDNSEMLISDKSIYREVPEKIVKRKFLGIF